MSVDHIHGMQEKEQEVASAGAMALGNALTWQHAAALSSLVPTVSHAVKDGNRCLSIPAFPLN